jgi:hypothetical protein
MKTLTLTGAQKTAVAAMLAHIASECTKVDVEAAFDDALDCEGEVNVAGLTFMPSRIWREMDPTAHRCGCNDYADGQDWTEIEGDTYQDDDIEKVKDEFLDTLREELSELETELSAASDPDDLAETRRMESAIADKKSDIEACENYAF